MKPMLFLLFLSKKLPLRGAFRDGNNCSRDACGYCRECQLGVTQHAERDAAQLTERLGGERQSGCEEPRAAERARSAEGGSHSCRDSEGHEAQDDDRRRHRG
jgi:hypothetical protein